MPPVKSYQRLLGLNKAEEAKWITVNRLKYTSTRFSPSADNATNVNNVVADWVNK